MKKLMSCDSVRRGMQKMAAKDGRCMSSRPVSKGGRGTGGWSWRGVRTLNSPVWSRHRPRGVFADIAKFLNRVATATQLAPEARWMVVVRYACRRFAFTKHEFPPWVDYQYMLNL